MDLIWYAKSLIKLRVDSIKEWLLWLRNKLQTIKIPYTHLLTIINYFKFKSLVSENVLRGMYWHTFLNSEKGLIEVSNTS